MAESEIDTSNRFMVARDAKRLFIMQKLPIALTDDDAINLAAWLVAMVADGDTKFAATIQAVRNT